MLLLLFALLLKERLTFAELLQLSTAKVINSGDFTLRLRMCMCSCIEVDLSKGGFITYMFVEYQQCIVGLSSQPSTVTGDSIKC